MAIIKKSFILVGIAFAVSLTLVGCEGCEKEDKKEGIKKPGKESVTEKAKPEKDKSKKDKDKDSKPKKGKPKNVLRIISLSTIGRDRL